MAVSSVALCLLLVGMSVSLNTEDVYHTAKSLLGKGANKLRIAEGKYTPPEEMDTSFWTDKAQASLIERANIEANTNKAKNTILFVGDGMSVATLTASRIYKGQLQGKTGEEETLSFENFPFSGLSKTYCVDGQVPDSACTATAYLTGVKTNMMVIGVNAHVNLNDCAASNDPANQVESIAKWAQEAGKSTGIVTTTTVTHASPSGAYAHVANRAWESDSDILNPGIDPAKCIDIAAQLITQDPGKNFNVILGGGRGKMIPKTVRDVSGVKGERSDGKNLIQQWKLNNPQGVYVDNRKDLLTTDYSQTDHLFGLFGYSHMDYYLQSDVNQPTLSEMTEAAIRTVEKNDKGFLLFIEGGRIDHAHHATTAIQAMAETLEFEKAVAKALEITNKNETLIVVTSDHSHSMSFNGYPGRGNDITNLNENDVDSKGVKYSTLTYAVGPQQYLDATGNRLDLTGKFNTDDFVYPSYIKGSMGNHAGEDVGIFASGPYSHWFSGVMEQNMIPHLMASASCIGKGRTICNPVLCHKN